MIMQDTSAVQQATEAIFGEVQFLGLELAVFVEKGVKALVILVLAWLTLRASRVLIGRLERRYVDEDTTTVSETELRGRTLAQLLNSVVRVVIALGAALTVLNLFIPIGPLLAGVGVAGLAISFGAQSLVKDIISGFFILLENQFSVGDIAEINGKGGVVERMTLRVVMLRDLEGILHIIPNGAISMVSNRTRSWSRVVIDVSVAYKENPDRVIAVLRDEADRFHRDADWEEKSAEEPAVLGVQSLGESSVDVRLVAQTLPGKQWEVKREFLRRIKNRFDREGIEIPFPQRTLHVASNEAIELPAARRTDREPS
jgi:small conductance mechanosensitive channel